MLTSFGSFDRLNSLDNLEVGIRADNPEYYMDKLVDSGSHVIAIKFMSGVSSQAQVESWYEL